MPIVAVLDTECKEDTGKEQPDVFLMVFMKCVLTDRLRVWYHLTHN